MKKFIDENVQNTTAFIIDITDEDLKTENATSIYQIRSYYNYVWTGETKGVYLFRNFFCYCLNCRNNWLQPCLFKDYTGGWTQKTQTYKSERILRRYGQNSEEEQE